ncbi:MurR/RpiR family transcriptional regulator [Chakrabartyella piscis]|uniref:MurR/RpiR family transcriptional regulator n=1 Tax=Chakrabartyella piscis TaxID=2918914 RepID=UPI0029587E1A|nr:MurR/RpiR family transcriptional regulator [Chakrabartyella piscis]
MTFEKRVYEKEFNLNDTDDSIIDYIREHKANIHDISIHKIAEALFISPNAIMRTAKKLGYSGFAELKFSLQKENSPNQIETVEHRVLEKIPSNIIKTLDVIDEEAIGRMVAKMHTVDRILFAGVGDSVPFCEIFYKYLKVVGKKTEFYHQAHDLEYTAKQYTKNDLIFFISASGQTPRIVDMAKKAKSAHIPCFCITHFGENPLSQLCAEQVCFWGENRVIDNYDITDKSGLILLIRMMAEKYWQIIQ